MKTYTNVNDMALIVKELILAADENPSEYDLGEITNELIEYDLEEQNFYFNDSLEDPEEFWEIVEKFKIEKDFSDVTNNELLESFEEATGDEYEYNEFKVEQLRKEILKRMNY